MLGQVQGYGLNYYPCNCAMLYHSRRQKLLNNFRNILLKIAIKWHKKAQNGTFLLPYLVSMCETR